MGCGVGGVERVRSRTTPRWAVNGENGGDGLGAERAFAQVQCEMPVRQASGDAEWASDL